MQTKSVGSADGGQIESPPIVHKALASTGQPLDASTRAFMEPRFGHDFSQVRVHTEENAPASAKAVGALAYAYGSDVIFGAGQYSPHTWEGRRLLAHELAHVVQQRSVSSQNDALADGNTTAEVEAERAATSAAHRYDVTVIRERLSDAVQLLPANARPTKPTLIRERDAITKRIDDAYGAGSLNETEWRNLVDSAEQAMAAGQTEVAQHAYLTLYSDVAKLAQATRVVVSGGGINVVTGSKTMCRDAKPGLNLSLGNQAAWGANASTAFVDPQGKFAVKLNPRGTTQPLVAIVLSRSAFRREKEQTLAILRHEMVHAEHDSEDAYQALRSNPRDRSAAAITSAGNTELLGYIEGFMTMFHLTEPAPTSPTHPAFLELLGALDVGRAETLPWAEADQSVKEEAMGRLQEYYCNALDRPHRRAFDDWVDAQFVIARRDEILSGEDSRGPADSDAGGLNERITTADVMGAMIRVKALAGGFFRSLKGIIAGKCKAVGTSMALPPRKA